jgi:hypothetical protein
MALPQVHIDRIQALTCEEDRGAIRSLSRLVLVEFDRLYIDAANARNQNVQMLALDACTNADLGPGHTISDLGEAGKRFSNLVCVKRSCTMADDPCFVRVTLKYDHIADGPNQNIAFNGEDQLPANRVLVGKGKTSIVDKSTNFYYPNGDRNFERTLIQVAHHYGNREWPAGIVSAKDTIRTVIQGGEITIPFPQSNFSVTGLVATDEPHILAKSICPSINSEIWQGDPVFTWLCTEASWELNDGDPGPNIVVPSLPIYRFKFEFQYNEDGWDPTVVFLDQRTGRPPHDVVWASEIAAIPSDPPATFATVLSKMTNLLDKDDPGSSNPDLLLVPAGIWKVPALRRVDFNVFLGSLVDGVTRPRK